MKTLALTLLLAVATLLAPQANAQRSSDKARAEEPSRFPALRKALREIRNEVRYHAGAIRDTASDIRHDVSSTIRGESTTPSYGYRDDERDSVYPPRTSERRRDPAPAYEDYYEEPPIDQTRPRPRLERERQREVENNSPQRREVAPPEPKIVAPKPQSGPASAPESARPKWMDDRRARDPQPKVESKPAPTPKPTAATPSPAPTPQPKIEPKPEPKIEPKPQPKPQPEPEVLKKEVEYPTAKRSDRAGFHHSPFPPYELLDTQGIEPGELARDPGSGKIFRIPK